MSSIYDGLTRCGVKTWLDLPRRAANEVHLVLSNEIELAKLCVWAREEGYYFCTLVANDERMLEDGVFKLYYVLSSATDAADQQDQLIILEHPLKPGLPYEFASIRQVFDSAGRLEDEALDLYGLAAVNVQSRPGFMLHECFPGDLYPLRQNRSHANLRERIGKKLPATVSAATLPPHGILYLTVGPIHAGVIQPGQFRFHVSGEVVEDLDIRLGYAHRGIEKLFATHYTLETGHELAARVTGDAPVAHVSAYCQAVEELADLPEPVPPAATRWRALLVELERLYNHIADVAALLHDMAFDLGASEIAVLRERVVRVNAALTGHRLLRGAVHPGGVAIRQPEALSGAIEELGDVVDRFLTVVDKLVLANPSCRARAITTGVLTEHEARKLGATGLPARASGLCSQDFRLRHPYGVFAEPGIREELQTLVRQTISEREDLAPSESGRRVLVSQADLQGDVFARLLLRVAEVETALQLIHRLAQDLLRSGPDVVLTHREALSRALKETPNFGIGLGYVEGWRGDVFYLLMKGPGNTIFRCQVRDPSLYNWPAVRLAVIRKPRVRAGATQTQSRPQFWENILADFPLINKSFNLSYAGHDR